MVQETAQTKSHTQTPLINTARPCPSPKAYHGRLTAIEDSSWLKQQIEELTTLHEAGRETPWKVSDAPESYIASLPRGIVGLEFAVERLEAVWKLNEEENVADLDGTQRGLEAGGPAAIELAEEIARRKLLSVLKPEN